MTDLRDQFNHTTDLSDFPEIAKLVGIYTARFASLELSTWNVYGFALGMTDTEAMWLLGDFFSFSSKMDAVERFVEVRRDKMPEADIIIGLFSEIRSINGFRNKLAHGIYLTDEVQTKVYISSHVTTPKYAKRIAEVASTDATNFFELSENSLKREIRSAELAHTKLMKLLKQVRSKSESYT
jgi:hypothetical protein